MKKSFLVIAFFALTLVLFAQMPAADAANPDTSEPAQAGQDLKELGKRIKDPIVLESSVSPLLNVTFNHSTHRSVPCRTCHHEEGSEGWYVSCSECHFIEGPRQTEVESSFHAFHSKESARSCYGCHQKMAAERPQDFPHFTNCRPCHMTDEARDAARAEARAAQ